MRKVAFGICIHICGFVIAFAIAGSARAATYQITDLGTLGGTVSYAFDVNIHGDVVGQSTTTTGETRAFLYHNGSMTNLGVLDATNNFSQAFGINDAGVVVGKSTQNGSDNGSRPFVYSAGTMSFVGSFGGNYGWANDINNAGQIVGISTKANGVAHAFRKTNSSMLDLGSFSMTSDYSIAYGINSLGDVTGYATTSSNGHYDAFLYTGESIQNLGDLGGNSRGFKINDSRYVVGDALFDSAGDERVLLWHGGTYTNLGITGGAVSADGGNLNSFNQVVGTLIFDLLDGTKNHGFLFSNGTMVDVNSLLPSNSGWVLRDAQAVNDRGQIVGFGNINGEQHAYLLSPFPGDYNRDGIVDARDFLVWRKDVGNLVPPCSGGDSNCNGFVENADYQPWRENFGRTAGSDSLFNSTVPEPSTLLLIGIGAISLLGYRKAKASG
jgi:probable HAF family extracellular repeat protein